MKWTNIGLVEAKKKDSEHFTTDNGIKTRRMLHPGIKKLVQLAVDKEIILEGYPKLDKDEQYIFASGHSFPSEVATSLAVIDRPTYILMGTTDQIDHNIQSYIAWINGMIYVDKFDQFSRKDSYNKMRRILNSGTSVLMFPEGTLNNSENEYCMKPYPGIYHLTQETNKLIVPMVCHNEFGSKYIYVKVGDPLDIRDKSKKEGLIELRDALSTLRFDLSRHNMPITREELGDNAREDYMEERKKIYQTVDWTRDVWDEEIMPYEEKDVVKSKEVWNCLDNINVTPENAYILAPLLSQREEEESCDFKKYMKLNWRKK